MLTGSGCKDANHGNSGYADESVRQVESCIMKISSFLKNSFGTVTC